MIFGLFLDQKERYSRLYLERRVAASYERLLVDSKIHLDGLVSAGGFDRLWRGRSCMFFSKSALSDDLTSHGDELRSRCD